MKWTALMLSLAGCIAPASTECDALLCPPGKVCAAGYEVCVFADQVHLCANQAEQAACNFDGAAGVCRLGVCVTPVCGDGIVVPPEVCDIADPKGGTCSTDCRSDLRCGNGIVDPGETCDCGDANLRSLPLGCKGLNSDDPTASCSARCTIHGCGDGTVSGLEQCDPAAPPEPQTCQGLGFYESTPVTCTSFCLYDQSPCHLKCGDGIVNGGEACDQAPPPGQSCLDYNFDGGHLGCHNPICIADVSGCVRAGWVRAATPGGILSGLVVKGHDDVYVVSDGNKVLHYDGGWKSLGSPSPQANGLVWANAVDDVFFVDMSSAGAFHYDGTSWTRILDSQVGLDAVYSSGRNDAFIGGTDKIWHWDGQTTTEMAVPAAIGTIRSIRGRAPNDVYALTINALLHYDGTSWTEKTATTGSMFAISQIWSGTLLATVQAGIGWYDIATDTWTVRSVPLLLGAFEGFEAWGAAPDDVFAVAVKGQVVHWDGKRWLPRQEPFRDDLTGIDGAAANDIWVSSSNSLFRYSGAEWQRDPLSFVPTGASAVPTGELVVVGQISNNVAYISDDGGVVSAPVLGPGAVVTRGTWASSTTDVWIGTNTVVHMTAGGTTTSSLGGFPSHFWGVSDTDVYAIEGSGLLHFDGSNWSFVVGAGQQAVWGTGSNDVFAVGAGGVISHWNGSTWSDQTSGTTTNLYGVWGTAPNDVYAVGSGGTVLHYDGNVWTPMASGLSTNLGFVTGTGPNDVFIVDSFGTARHYDGTAWLPLRLPSTGLVIDIAATAAAFYVVTDEPAVYRLLRTARPWP